LELERAAGVAGLKHIVNAATDPATHHALLNTAYYAFASIPLGLGSALVLAVLLNRRQGMRGSTLARTLIFLPSVMSGVAVAFMWAWTFDPNLGIVNRALKVIGIDGPGWFTDPLWAMPTLILLNLWGIGGTC